MQKRNKKKIKKTAVLIFFFILVLFLGYVSKDFVDFYNNKGFERCKMYNDGEVPNVNGLYFLEEDYYCVWTKGRSFDRINTTEYHEACHALINKDTKHFCNNISMRGIK